VLAEVKGAMALEVVAPVVAEAEAATVEGSTNRWLVRMGWVEHREGVVSHSAANAGRSEFCRALAGE